MANDEPPKTAATAVEAAFGPERERTPRPEQDPLKLAQAIVAGLEFNHRIPHATRMMALAAGLIIESKRGGEQMMDVIKGVKLLWSQLPVKAKT